MLFRSILRCLVETIFFGAAIMIVGAALQFTSYSLGQLIAGRIVTGVGNGESSQSSREEHVTD